MKDQDQSARDLSDILRGAAAVFGGFLSRTGTRLAFLFVAGNLYGAEALGELAIFLAVVETLAAIAVFGLKKSLFGFVGDEDADTERISAIVLNALAFSVGLGLLFAVFLASVAWPSLDLPGSAPYLPFFAFVIPVIVMTDILLTATRIRRVMRYLVMARSIIEPIALLFLAVVFFLTDLRENGLLFAYTGSMLVTVAVSLYGYGKLFSFRALFAAKINAGDIRHIANISLPTTLADIGSLLIRRIDIFFLWYFTSEEVVGIYYAVHNIASNIQKTRQLFSPVLAPIVAQAMARESMAAVAERLRLVSRWILTLQLAQLILLSLFATPLLSLVGPGMEAGAAALIIMLVGEVIEGTFGLYDLPLIFKRPSLNAWFVTIGTLLMAGLCYLLIPVLDMRGAALALALALLFINAARLYSLVRAFGVVGLDRSYLKPLGAAAIAVLILSLFNIIMPIDAGWAIAAGVFLTIFFYVGMLFLLGFDGQDRELYRILRGKKKA